MSQVSELKLQNVLDYFAPAWHTKKVFADRNFDEFLQLENIPVRWFLQRMFCLHTMPTKLDMSKRIKNWQDTKIIGKSKSSFVMRKLLVANERIKTKMSKKNEIQEKEIIFLAYLNHLNFTEKKIYRLENVLPELRKQKNVEVAMITRFSDSPLVLQACIKKNQVTEVFDSTLYEYASREVVKKARNVAQELYSKWKSISEEQKKELFGEEFYAIIKPALDFYYSKEYLQVLTLQYYLVREMVLSHKAQEVVTTAINGITERCVMGVNKNIGKKTFIIQHGAGLGNVEFDAIGDFSVSVFSDYYKEKLVEKGVSEERIFVTGPLMFEEIVKYKQETNKQTNLLRGKENTHVVLCTVPFVEQGFHTHKEYFRYFREIMKEICSLEKVRVSIKLHPREQTVEVYRQIITEDFKNTEVEIINKHGNDVLYQLLEQADVVLNFSSTVALEAMILGKPVITISMPNFSNDFNQLLRESKASLETFIGKDLAITIKRALESKDLEKYAERFVEYMCGIIDGKSAQRVAKEIVARIDNG